MAARLHLLCSASTYSVRSVAFSADEPLDPQGQESLSRLAGRLPSFDDALRSPALCAAQTAEALAPDAKIDPLLRDCDFGRWAGRSFINVRAEEPDALARWLQDPGAAPHDGESFADVISRVGAWLDGFLESSGTILAVTHPTIIRAAIAYALGAGPQSLRHLDIGPLSRAKLSGGGGRWTLSALVPLRDAR